MELGAVTYTTDPIWVEFVTGKLYSAGGRIVILSLWDGVPGAGGTNLGFVASFDARGVANGVNTGFPIHTATKITPSAGSHNYGIYGFILIGVPLTTGVSAGAGGAGAFNPAFIQATFV